MDRGTQFSYVYFKKTKQKNIILIHKSMQTKANFQ